MDEALLKEYKELLVGNLMIAVEEKHLIWDVEPDEHRPKDIVVKTHSLDSNRPLNVSFERDRFERFLQGETLYGWTEFSLVKITS